MTANLEVKKIDANSEVLKVTFNKEGSDSTVQITFPIKDSLYYPYVVKALNQLYRVLIDEAQKGI